MWAASRKSLHVRVCRLRDEGFAIDSMMDPGNLCEVEYVLVKEPEQ